MSRCKAASIDPHEILRVVEPPAVARLVGRGDPAFGDQGQEHAALRQLLAEKIDEIDAGRDGVDVHKQLVQVEIPLQPVMQPPGPNLGVGTAIIDDDLPGGLRHLRSPKPS